MFEPKFKLGELVQVNGGRCVYEVVKVDSFGNSHWYDVMSYDREQDVIATTTSN